MHKVFNEALLSDMERTEVRKYLKTTDAQAVWKEYSEYMTTLSKGASEKRKLTHYLTNAVLDGQFRGITQQLIIRFNEQFRRLDDLTDISERMPESVRMLSRTSPSSALLKLLISIPPPFVEMIHSHISTIHLTTISSSMLVLGMMPLKHQHIPKGEMYMLLQVLRISVLLKTLMEHSSLKTLIHHQIISIRYIRPKIAQSPPDHYLGSSGIISENQPPLHPRSLLRNMMDLYMYLLKFTSSSALRQLLPLTNTILRPSTKLLRREIFVSLVSLTMNYPQLRIPFWTNNLTFIKMMFQLRQRLIQSLITSTANTIKRKT